jgi:hypothetical protein
MQWLIAENERLRRTGKIDRIVYWVCIGAVVVVAILKYKGVI